MWLTGVFVFSDYIDHDGFNLLKRREQEATQLRYNSVRDRTSWITSAQQKAQHMAGFRELVEKGESTDLQKVELRASEEQQQAIERGKHAAVRDAQSANKKISSS